MHPFPLVRSGGMFVFFIGMGIVVGAMLGERYLIVPLIVGAALAIISQAAFGQRVTAPLGTPTRLQIAVLVGSIVLESISLGVVGAVCGSQSLRVLLLWVLIVVAAHFFLIAVAEGPLLVALGGLCLLNAIIGIWLPHVSLSVFWMVDGLLKIASGVFMFRTPAQQENLSQLPAQ